MGLKAKFDDRTCADLRRRHEAGETVRGLATEFDVYFEVIKRAIIRAGGTILARPRAKPHEDVRFPGVIAIAVSQNSKLGECATTTVSAVTCPASCPFLNGGCYAEYDQTSIQWKRATAGTGGMSALEVAKSEAAAINALPATRDLRLHVAGDSPTRDGTRAVAEACFNYVARGLVLGKRLAAFGYTHAFRTVLRSDWWAVSVLASCETVADVRSAWRRGYAAALTVPQFPNGAKAFEVKDGDEAVKCIPCPAQSAEKTCSECRLCMDDRRLLAERTVIAFAVHGSGSKRAKERLGRVALPVVTTRGGEDVQGERADRVGEGGTDGPQGGLRVRPRGDVRGGAVPAR